MILKNFPTIALAESNEEDANSLLSALQQAAPNLNVDLLQNGEEVLQYFFSSDKRGAENSRVLACDLLLLNLALPRLDGFKVLRQLQWLFRDDLTQLPPIVVLCDSDHPQFIAQAYRYGAKGFLCKVMPPGQLTAAIEQVLHYWIDVTLQPPRERSRIRSALRRWWPVGLGGPGQQELAVQ